MNYEIRPARKEDEEFLWQMLYYAAHMDEQGVAAESARTDPNLAETPELAIAVAPEQLGTGVGTLLLARLLDDARRIHRAIALSVRADNPAKRLYERMGFVTVASITNRVGTESLLMRVELR
jgi:GNAT superfamily N-acetyltransferase